MLFLECHVSRKIDRCCRFQDISWPNSCNIIRDSNFAEGGHRLRQSVQRDCDPSEVLSEIQGLTRADTAIFLNFGISFYRWFRQWRHNFEFRSRNRKILWMSFPVNDDFLLWNDSFITRSCCRLYKINLACRGSLATK